MSFSKSNSIRIILLMMGTYIGICIGMALMQDYFLYHPNPIKSDIAIARQTIPSLKEVHYPTDTAPYYAFFSSPKKGKPIVVFFHGNSYHLNTFLGRVKPFIEWGYGVLMPEYTGFGGIAGQRRQAYLEQDAARAVDFLHSRGYHNRDIILYGYSLGTYLAVHTAAEARTPFRAVILEAPFTSLIDVASATVHHLLPVGLFMQDGYFTIDKIKSIRAPLFIAHGKADDVVPYESGHALFLAAEAPKTFFSVDTANHRSLPQQGLFEAVWDWLSSAP